MNNAGSMTGKPRLNSSELLSHSVRRSKIRFDAIKKHILPLAAYTVLTVVMTSPFVSIGNLFSSILLNGDPGYVMWAISWDNHALLTQPRHLFAANVFYPSAGTLAFSEDAFGIAVLVHPWYWFSDNPVFPYNLLFLFSYFASAVGMYLLCVFYTRSPGAAFIGGLIFGFCFFRAHHFGHLHLISNQWFPFVILLFHKLRQQFSWRKATLWVLLMVLQCLTSWYNAFFIVMILLWVLAADFLENRWDRKTWLRFAVCGAATGLLLIKFYIPYWRIAQPPDYSQNKAFAADLGSYFQAPWNTLLGRYLGNTKRWIWEERTTFMGYIPFALLVADVAMNFRRKLTWTYFSLAVFAFMLSLGPESLDFPGVKLPASYIYRVFPPLVQLRACARFAIVVMFCMSVLAAIAVERLKGCRRWVPLLLILIFLEYMPIGLNWDPRTTPPFKPREVDIWLKAHNIPQKGPPGWRRPEQRDRKVLLELPHYVPTPHDESLYMLYSTQHWMNLVNGYARFYPPDFATRFSHYSQFPSGESLDWMRQTGIDYVVVHSYRYDQPRRQTLESSPLLVARFGNDLIFKLR